MKSNHGVISIETVMNPADSFDLAQRVPDANYSVPQFQTLQRNFLSYHFENKPTQRLIRTFSKVSHKRLLPIQVRIWIISRNIYTNTIFEMTTDTGLYFDYFKKYLPKQFLKL